MARLFSLGVVSLFAVSCMFETRSRPERILFLGNSITLSVKNPKVGWPIDAGMAASAPALDYVHQTERLLREKGMDVEAVIGSRDCEICDGVIGELMENIEVVGEIRPRSVVVQLGENSDLIQIRSGRLTREYGELLQALFDRGVREVFCLSNWDEGSIEDPHNNTILKAILRYPQVHWVDITGLAGHPENYGDSALYPDRDVQWHPGDKGMLRIAEILSSTILETR